LRARDLNLRSGLPEPIASAKRQFSAGDFAALCWPEDGLRIIDRNSVSRQPGWG
jgi:hypothetical protein